MNHVGTRLVAFTLVLAGAFGTAYAAGEKLPGHSHSDGHAADHTDMQSAGPIPPAAGTDDYRLVPDTNSDRSVLAFHVVDPDGRQVRDFAETHGALLHTVVVRPDLSDFQHIHPAIASDGSWTVPLDQPGPWHIVFEMLPTGSADEVVMAWDSDDGTPFTASPLPAPDDIVEVQDLTISRDGLNFTIASDDGSPVEGLEPYLGQPSHVIAMRQGDLAYLHAHPTGDMAGMLMSTDTLGGPGTYRVFLQFGYRGEVLTVPFTVVLP